MPKYRSKYKKESEDLEFEEETPLEIIPRSVWTDEPAETENGPLKIPCLDVVVTHTETKRCKTKEACIRLIKKIYKQHRDKGMADIAHNFTTDFGYCKMTARDDGSFLIGEDGNVYEGRGWKLKPFPIRRIKDNPSSDEYLQVAFLGTFGDGDGDERRPTMELSYGLQDLVEFGMEKGFLEEGVLPPPEARLPPPTRAAEVDVSQFD